MKIPICYMLSDSLMLGYIIFSLYQESVKARIFKEKGAKEVRRAKVAKLECCFPVKS